MSTHDCSLLVSVVAISLALLTMPAVAMETEIKIDQDKAIAGGVTPGDAPGFPITLTQPGRYVLTSNLYPPADTDGIEIKSHDITIDFNGFRLHGFGQAQSGIRVSDVSNPSNTATIMNGVIAGFKGNAILGSDFWTVENMRILVNGGGVVLNDWARVQRSTIAFSDIGIDCRQSCLIEDNNVSSNQRIGIIILSGTVVRNSIFNNVLHGIQGASAEFGGAVGFGHNTLAGNNQGNVQVLHVTPLNPNFCAPAC